MASTANKINPINDYEIWLKHCSRAVNYKLSINSFTNIKDKRTCYDIQDQCFMKLI